MEAARAIDLPVHVLPAWYDVDELDALRLLHAELIEGRSFAPDLQSHRAPRTAELMRTLLSGADLAARLDIIQARCVEEVGE
jgi:hypothetical protein